METNQIEGQTSHSVTDFTGISLEGFLVWAESEYEKDPTTKVTVKFLLECLMPELAETHEEKTIIDNSQIPEPSWNVNRLEIIDHTDTGIGRDYITMQDEPFTVTTSVQDDGRTLKLFLSDVRDQ